MSTDVKVESSTTNAEDLFYADNKPDVKAESSTAAPRSEAPTVRVDAATTEAASEPADTDLEPTGDGRSSKARNWASLRRENAALKARADLLQEQAQEREKAASLTAKPARETKPAEPTGKPKLADFTEKIGTDFDTYEAAQEAYQDARDTWNRSDWELKEVEKQRLATETAEKQKTDDAAKAQKSKWDERADITRQSNKDFDAIAYSDKLPINPATHAFLMQSEIGPDVLLALGLDLKEAARIASLDAHSTYVALVKIESGIQAKAEAAKGSIPKITQAPRPAVDVGGIPAGGAKELSLEEQFYGKN